MSKEVRAVIVGSGMMGVQHALALRRVVGVNVAGICAPMCADIKKKA